MLVKQALVRGSPGSGDRRYDYFRLNMELKCINNTAVKQSSKDGDFMAMSRSLVIGCDATVVSR